MKRRARFYAFFYKAYRRALDRHDRCGQVPTGRVGRGVTVYELDVSSRLDEDPPYIVMPSSGSGRWLRRRV